MLSSVAAVIAVIAGDRAGIWKIPEPSRIRDVFPAIQPSTVAASDPYASALHTESYPASSAAVTISSCCSGVIPSPQ